MIQIIRCANIAVNIDRRTNLVAVEDLTDQQFSNPRENNFRHKNN